ncbi:MAG: Holliday junction resolvase RuvX [Anaerolineales bacterium]|nr:Holliday junction resolvase RuvX [Anaerolineales bacterium]
MAENGIGCILGLDAGEKRIGVAVSDPLRIVARPLTTIRHTSREADLAAISQLVKDHQVVLVVCGYPLSLNDSEGPQGVRIRRFAGDLEKILTVPVELWDESYSTQEAEEILKQKGHTSPDRRKNLIDTYAAAIILQSYMDAHSQLVDYPPDNDQSPL